MWGGLGGGGCNVFLTFFAISNISRKKIWEFIFISSIHAIFNIKKNNNNNIEKCPFTYWLNGRWFLQIVDGDSWNLYPLYPLFLCSAFVSQMWGGLGGGGGV